MGANNIGDTIEGEFTEVSSAREKLQNFGNEYNKFCLGAIKQVAKNLALCATVATGVAVGNIASDPDRDIMDIPEDVKTWFDEHPELDSWTFTRDDTQPEETAALSLEQ